jgi:hypothetical protein
MASIAIDTETANNPWYTFETQRRAFKFPGLNSLAEKKFFKKTATETRRLVVLIIMALLEDNYVLT